MTNPNPMADIHYDLAGKIADKFGYDQCVIIAVRTGEDGGVCVTSGGLTVRDGAVAKEAAQWITANLSGWLPKEADDIDSMARKEYAKLAEGPESDPNFGKRLIHLPGVKKR